MRRRMWRVTIIIAGVLAAAVATVAAEPNDRDELLRIRQAVWVAWCNNDTKQLDKLVPPDTIVISSGQEKWKGRREVLQTAAKFRAKGGKLIRLEFPRTEVQFFGDVAMTYSTYVMELEVGGKHSTESGRVTEVFVRRNGEWTNPGWHTDSEVFH
jgi:ketosteroid isomerase-like protein